VTVTVHRSGFACFVGRPNTGKSTLTNALVGMKVAIATDRPQTTRHAIRGIVHRPDAQLVPVDTPGLHKPRTLLGERLNDVVRTTLAEVDVIGLCIPANEPIGGGDRFIAQQLQTVAAKTPVIAIVTKSDLVTDRNQMAAQLMAVQALGEWDEIVPVSAVTDDQTELLRDLFIARLPEGPPLYVDGELTDEPELVMVAEFIREAAIEGVFDELPHSINVVIEEMSAREGKDLIDISAVLYVERDSQKGIVIGPGGARLREVGTKARAQIEALLGSRTYLDLRVKVAKDWQRDPKQLRRMGF
jgi:GTP-binding protein Era